MPFGMLGGFGGLPYTSPGSAVLRGLEAGAGFVNQQQQEEDRRQQAQFERNRQDRIDQMDQAHKAFIEKHITDEDQRANVTQATNMLLKERDDLRDEGASNLSQYGSPDRVPADVAANYAQRVKDWNSRWGSVQQATYAPFVAAQEARAKDTIAGLQNNTIDPADPANAQDIHHAVLVASHQDPANFLPPADGQKSPVDVALDKLHMSFGAGDKAGIGDATQQLFGNQFNTHLGLLDPAGGVITSRSLNPDTPFVPNPDGSAAMPVLSVTGTHDDGSTTTQPAAAPALDHSDPDTLHQVTPQTMLDHAGALGTLSTIVAAHPGVQAALRAGVNKPDQDALDFGQAYTAIGAARGTKTSIKEVNGQLVAYQEDRLGNITGTPKVLASTAKQDPQLAAIDDLEQRGVLTAPQATQARGVHLGLVPRAGEHQPNAESIKAAAAQRLVGQTNPDTGEPYTQGDVDRMLVGGVRSAADNIPSNQISAEVASARDDVLSSHGLVKSDMSPTGYLKADTTSGKDRPATAAEILAAQQEARQAGESRRQELLGAKRHAAARAPAATTIGVDPNAQPGSFNAGLNTGADVSAVGASPLQPQGQPIPLDQFLKSKGF